MGGGLVLIAFVSWIVHLTYGNTAMRKYLVRPRLARNLCAADIIDWFPGPAIKRIESSLAVSPHTALKDGWPQLSESL